MRAHQHIEGPNQVTACRTILVQTPVDASSGLHGVRKRIPTYQHESFPPAEPAAGQRSAGAC